MTTIAAAKRGNWIVMSCDGRMSCGDLILDSKHNKVFRVRDMLIGFAGDAAQGHAMIEWYQAGSEGKPPKCDKVCLLIVFPDGAAFSRDDGDPPVPLELPASIGTGAHYALAAMDLGKPPADAVRAAIKRDINSGGQITTLRMRRI